MTDAEVGVIASAIVTAGGTIGTLIARAVRWAARIYRDAQLTAVAVVRDNSEAMNRFSKALGRIEGVTLAHRERTGPVPIPVGYDDDLDTPAERPHRRKHRAESEPKE